MTTPSAPLAGRTVIITRSPTDNRRLAAELRGLGATAIEIPLTDVLPPDDGGTALRAALDELDRYRWMVLTSANGARAVGDALGSRRWPADVAVAVVGPATEEAARSGGLPVTLVAPEATAAHLVEAMPRCEDEAAGRVLAPLAELASTTVVDGLTAKGYRVDRITAYRTGPPDAEPQGDAAITPLADADAVAFFAPSAVDRYMQRFGSPALPATIICVGPSTAARAAELGIDDPVTAEPHTAAGVVAALTGRFGPR